MTEPELDVWWLELNRCDKLTIYETIKALKEIKTGE